MYRTHNLDDWLTHPFFSQTKFPEYAKYIDIEENSLLELIHIYDPGFLQLQNKLVITYPLDHKVRFIPLVDANDFMSGGLEY
jgi:hypothetical protein